MSCLTQESDGRLVRRLATCLFLAHDFTYRRAASYLLFGATADTGHPPGPAHSGRPRSAARPDLAGKSLRSVWQGGGYGR